MRRSTIIRIILWVLWTFWTAAYIFPKFFRETAEYIAQKIGVWIMDNPEIVLLIIWFLCTIALLLDIALKAGRENDPLAKYQKLRYTEEEDEMKMY